MPELYANLRSDFRKLDKLERELPSRTQTANYQAAQALKQRMIDNWSPDSPSLPYAAPAKVSGELERSIVITQNRERGQFRSGFTVAVTSEYGAALEFGSGVTNLLPRPYFHPALFWLEQNFGYYYKDIFGVR